MKCVYTSSSSSMSTHKYFTSNINTFSPLIISFNMSRFGENIYLHFRFQIVFYIFIYCIFGLIIFKIWFACTGDQRTGCHGIFALTIRLDLLMISVRDFRRCSLFYGVQNTFINSFRINPPFFLEVYRHTILLVQRNAAMYCTQWIKRFLR